MKVKVYQKIQEIFCSRSFEEGKWVGLRCQVPTSQKLSWDPVLKQRKIWGTINRLSLIYEINGGATYR